MKHKVNTVQKGVRVSYTKSVYLKKKTKTKTTAGQTLNKLRRALKFGLNSSESIDTKKQSGNIYFNHFPCQKNSLV